jgi:hypothetical protein
MAAHPNQLDHKRIERALSQRERYRYVTPQVIADDEEHGYRIESPCCSRNVEPAGGIIDIALLKYLNGHGKSSAIDDETCHARFPLSGSLPQTGERGKASLREFDDKPHWLLYRKDHDYSTWVLHSVVDTLHAALEILLPDEERVFWP